MNKRIEELAELCTTSYRDGNGEYIDQVDAEKFAELIVHECDSLMSKYEQANMESDIWVEMMDQMRKELKEHFGIE